MMCPAKCFQTIKIFARKNNIMRREFRICASQKIRNRLELFGDWRNVATKPVTSKSSVSVFSMAQNNRRAWCRPSALKHQKHASPLKRHRARPHKPQPKGGHSALGLSSWTHKLSVGNPMVNDAQAPLAGAVKSCSKAKGCWVNAGPNFVNKLRAFWNP